MLELGPEFIDIASYPGVRVDLRYARPDNFTGQNLYSGLLEKVYLHFEAAEKLKSAAASLKRERSELSLLVFDGLRPRSVQRRMWARVKGTPQEKYVADPELGSIHCFGLAVDLSLADASGHELDMGTPFDSFQELAEPRHEERFLRSGELTPLQVQNRRLLRNIMVAAGFESIDFEWWHFNAVPFSQARLRYVIIE